MQEQGALAPCALLADAPREIAHDVRNVDLLRTEGLTMAAADAGGRLFVCRQRVYRIAGRKASVGIDHVVIQPDEFRDVERSRTMLDAVTAGRAGDARAHAPADAGQCLHLILIQRLFIGKGLDVFLQLLHVRHA